MFGRQAGTRNKLNIAAERVSHQQVAQRCRSLCTYLPTGATVSYTEKAHTKSDFIGANYKVKVSLLLYGREILLVHRRNPSRHQAVVLA